MEFSFGTESDTKEIIKMTKQSTINSKYEQKNQTLSTILKTHLLFLQYDQRKLRFLKVMRYNESQIE